MNKKIKKWRLLKWSMKLLSLNMVKIMIKKESNKMKIYINKVLVYADSIKDVIIMVEDDEDEFPHLGIKQTDHIIEIPIHLINEISIEGIYLINPSVDELYDLKNFFYNEHVKKYGNAYDKTKQMRFI